MQCGHMTSVSLSFSKDDGISRCVRRLVQALTVQAGSDVAKCNAILVLAVDSGTL